MDGIQKTTNYRPCSSYNGAVEKTRTSTLVTEQRGGDGGIRTHETVSRLHTGAAGED